MENKKKFLLFCIEVMQAGVALTKKEMEIVFQAAEKLEGFTDKDFENLKEEDYVKMTERMFQSLNKRKAFIESCTFNILTRMKLEDMENEDTTELVMKAKYFAAKMADEFLEPDEKLEKVVKDGRRVIEHFIDQWKNMQNTSTDEIIEPEVVE